MQESEKHGEQWNERGTDDQRNDAARDWSVQITRVEERKSDKSVYLTVSRLTHTRSIGTLCEVPRGIHKL